MKIPTILVNFIVWAVITTAVVLLLIFKFGVAHQKITIFITVMLLVYLLIITRSQSSVKS